MLPIVETWIWYQYADQIGAVSGNWHFDYEELEFQYINHKPILEFYQTLRDRGVAFPGGLSLENDPARAQFSEGNVGMMLAASWDIGVFNDQFPANHEWGVAHLPTPDGQRRGKGQMGGGGSFWLTSVADFPEVAAQWLAFMVDDEYLIGYYERGLGLPVRPEIAQQADTPAAYGFPGYADKNQSGVQNLQTSSRVSHAESGDCGFFCFYALPSSMGLEPVVFSVRRFQATDLARSAELCEALPTRPVVVAFGLEHVLLLVRKARDGVAVSVGSCGRAEPKSVREKLLSRVVFPAARDEHCDHGACFLLHLFAVSGDTQWDPRFARDHIGADRVVGYRWYGDDQHDVRERMAELRHQHGVVPRGASSDTRRSL